jgi:hypothetical protein
VKSDESQYSAPTPEEAKALIYFVADGHLTSPFELTESWWVPSTVEGISSWQSIPVNTISARCCNPFFH